MWQLRGGLTLIVALGAMACGSSSGSGAQDTGTDTDVADAGLDDSSPFTTGDTAAESDGTSTGALSTTDGEGGVTTGNVGTTASESDDQGGNTTAAELTDGGATDSSTGVEGEFPPAGEFGDTVTETDLVGTWVMTWPDVGESVLVFDGLGNWTWTESTADCGSQTVSSGIAWAEGIQVVLHVDQWDRALPWDTSETVGETFPPPFRLALSVSLQSCPSGACMGIAGPVGLTSVAPYDGQSFVQTVVGDAHLGGTWRGEAELRAIPQGELEPAVVVRDTFEGLLEDDPDPGVPVEATGVLTHTARVFLPDSQEIEYFNMNWTCTAGCSPEALAAGTTLIAGANGYSWGTWAGFRHLLPTDAGRTFVLGATPACPVGGA